MRKAKRSTLVTNLDTIFSKYIRTKYSKNGNVECVTCGRVYDISKIQNGHFISRKHYATRWDEENVAPQCYGCNVMQYGQQYLFAKWIDKTYGEGFQIVAPWNSMLIHKVRQQSISEIPDVFSREEYCKIYHQKLGIDEGNLIKQVDKARARISKSRMTRI